MAVSDVISKLRQSDTRRVRLTLRDGTEVEVLVEEKQYHAAKSGRRWVDPGHLYVSLVETDDVEKAYDLPYKADALVEIHATEKEPGEWDEARLTFEDVYSGAKDEVEHHQLGVIDSVERID